MCVTPTGEDRNASIPLIFLLHCLCGSCPLLLHSQHFKGALGSGCATLLLSSAMLPLPVGLSSGATSAGPPSHPPLPWQFPWHVALHALIRHLSCGSSKFPQFPFQYLFSCNSPGGNKCFCIVRNNITFSISCLPVELSLQIMG